MSGGSVAKSLFSIRAFLIWGISSLALAGVLWIVFRAQAGANLIVAQAAEQQTARLAARSISGELSTIRSDLLYLSDQTALRDWLQNKRPDARARLAAEYLAFARRKMCYDQIRLLNESGQEIVRVNWNNGHPAEVPRQALQDKAARDYVRKTLALGPDEVYISPFDLNIERGKIEQPLKPVIRFSVPLFDRWKHRRGLIVLNYLGQRVLDQLQAASAQAGDDIWLLNAKGFWLRGPRQDEDWRFMYPERPAAGFNTRHPRLWKWIVAGPDDGQRRENGALYTYAKVFQHGVAAAGAGARPTSRQWIVVTHISAAQLAARTTTGPARRLGWTFVGIDLLLAAAAGLIAYYSAMRREAERAIRELNARLARHNAELEAVNRELEAFSYSVSHDLRAPLRAIDGFSRILQHDCADRLNDAGRGHLDRVRRAAQNMAALIDDLLKLSRVTRAELQWEETDLSAMAAEVIDELQGHEPERRVQISIQPGLVARGDRQLLRVALVNLLGNAWKFTRDKADAQITFGRAGEAYFVRDNGAGFDMAYVDKLFNAFQRLHDASQFPGTGIGLATVQRIIHKHGGRIWVEAIVDQGATFYFTLQAEKMHERESHSFSGR